MNPLLKVILTPKAIVIFIIVAIIILVGLGYIEFAKEGAYPFIWKIG